MTRFSVKESGIEGLLVVERLRLADARGFLARLFCAEEFRLFGWDQPVAQINHTFTLRRGTVRGMHFQHHPHCEKKLVNCLRGEIWDVAVDIRHGSPTFLHWHGETLSAGNCRSLLLPEGFAHGFQALTDDAELIYLHSAPYAAEAEGALHPLDPELAIEWPLPVQDMSEKDSSHPFIDSTFAGVRL
jgi:dTDP-4-dehydrorhamnose 3,5-epimerase